MITIRNADLALSVSARASTADMQPGMIVAFVQGAASGDQPKVRKATEAEIEDITIQKGIVDYIPEESLTADFDVNVVTQALTAKSDTIPLNSQVNVWMGTVVIAYHEVKLPAGFKAVNAREADRVAFSSATNLPGKYAGGDTIGLQISVGIVYRVDGPEVTMIVKL